MAHLRLFYQHMKRSLSTSNTRKNGTFKSIIDTAFNKYLLLTNVASSGILMAFGDIAQQEIEFQRGLLEKRYDLKRLVRMTTIGFAFGPLHHYFYVYLNKIYPGTDIMSISKKILADQIVMSPACIATFFYGMGILESKSMAESHDEFKKKFMEVYKVDWLIWPPTQFLNFYFVPASYQVLYINAITMLYDVFLSYIKYRDKDEVSDKVK